MESDYKLSEEKKGRINYHRKNSPDYDSINVNMNKGEICIM